MKICFPLQIIMITNKYKCTILYNNTNIYVEYALYIKYNCITNRYKNDDDLFKKRLFESICYIVG